MTQVTQVTGAFKTMSWDEKPYDEAAGQPKFTHAHVTHELTGDITGEVSICYLMVYRPDQSANFVGLAMVTGAIGDREGSFVMQDVGTYADGIAKGHWSVLPGLGAGALRDVRGEGHFAASHTSASYLLDLTL